MRIIVGILGLLIALVVILQLTKTQLKEVSALKPPAVGASSSAGLNGQAAVNAQIQQMQQDIQKAAEANAAQQRAAMEQP
jgi:xanthine dehydrogenase molybdopterin-binding subunit B